MCCCLAGTRPLHAPALDVGPAAGYGACALLALTQPQAKGPTNTHAPGPFGPPRLLALPRGAVLFRQGDACRAVYAVRTGGLKTEVVSADGRHQTVGFHLSGELVGLPALGLGRQIGEVMALEDSQVCVLSLHHRPDPMALPELLQQRLLAELAEALQQAYHLQILLGCRSAQVRLCSFVQELSRRASLQGLSATQLRLPMTRHDIGSYLGLTVETVSRMLSRLHDAEVLEVHRREVRVLDAPTLLRLSTPPARERAAGKHWPKNTSLSNTLPRWEAARADTTGPARNSGASAV